MLKIDLLKRALHARERALAPYSGYRVGAALLAKSGKVYEGFNIENASYSATICAERAAFCAALLAGERSFEMLAIAGGREEAENSVPPCGICRQFMAEFCAADFEIIWGNEAQNESHTLAELLPYGFTSENLEE